MNFVGSSFILNYTGFGSRIFVCRRPSFVTVTLGHVVSIGQSSSAGSLLTFSFDGVAGRDVIAQSRALASRSTNGTDGYSVWLMCEF